MNYFDCQSEQTLSKETIAELSDCPFSEKSIGKKDTANSLELVLTMICQKLGESGMRDGKKLIGCFRDLAPSMKKEQKMLALFVDCKGHTQFLNALHNKDADVSAISDQIVKQMTDELMAKEHCMMICKAFCNAIGFQNSLDKPQAQRPAPPAQNAKAATSLSSIPVPQLSSDTGRAKEQKKKSGKSSGKTGIALICAALGICLVLAVLWFSGVLFNRPQQRLSDDFFDTAKQGDAFFLGKYEQDNNAENGPEDIEWIVVNNDDGLILAISKYVLDNQPYHALDSYTATDWENCTLRKWLNKDFFDASFTEEEKAKICTVKLQNPDAYFYFLPGGNHTIDRVFLLSCADITAYYDDYEFVLESLSWDTAAQKLLMTTSNQSEYALLRTTLTDYAKETYIKSQMEARKQMTEEQARELYGETEEEYGDGACLWWMRTRGDNWYSNMVVTYSGSAFAIPSHSKAVGVRPAILVSKDQPQPEEDMIAAYDPISDIVELVDEELSERYEVSYTRQILYGDRQVYCLGEDGLVYKFAHSGCKVFTEWSEIKRIAVSGDLVVAVTSDGDVMLSPEGREIYGTDALPLHNIVDVCISDQAYGPNDETKKGCIICLTDDGTAYFTYADGYKGYEPNVQAISACSNKFAIVYQDGTVDGYKFDNETYAEVLEWTDILQTACGDTFIAGLKKDGTVVVSGGYLSASLNGSQILLYDGDETGTNTVEMDVSGWTDIVSISAGAHHLVGLRSDGTAVAVGLDTYGQCSTEGFTGIASIEASGNTTILNKAERNPNESYYLIGKDIILNIVNLTNGATALLEYGP